MQSSEQELLQTLEKIKGLPILVVGDIILDRYIWGTVDRISPEAPVPVVLVKKTEDRLGGAGNVCRNLKNIHAEVSLCGFIGDDEDGQVALQQLEKESIKRDGVIIDRGRPTCVKTRVIAHNQQIVRIDRETKAPQGIALKEGFAAVVDAHLDDSRAVIISDYGKGAVAEPLIRKLEVARAAGKLSLQQRPMVVDPHPANYGIYGGMSVAKPNRREAEAASGIKIDSPESAFEAAKILLKRWKADMVMVTLGEDGLAIAQKGMNEPIFRDTVAREVFDVSGAGDAVTAVFTAALAAGAGPSLAGDLANIAAGVVVSEVGTVAIDPEKLRKEIARLTHS